MVVHTQDKAPVSHQLTEVKLLQALVVLWWGTTWEGKVMTTPRNFFLPFLPAIRGRREWEGFFPKRIAKPGLEPGFPDVL